MSNTKQVSEKVVVNKEQCERIAKLLLPLNLRKNHLERLFLKFPSDRETKLRAFLFAAAICHQTHTLINKKKNLKGWGCLEDVFTELGKSRSSLLDPGVLSKLSPISLAGKLQPLFAEDANPEHCSLDRLEERAYFMIQISGVLLEKYGGNVERMIDQSGGFLLKGRAGLYLLLEGFEAFADPFRKKSTVFIQLAANAHLFEIKDPESIEPVMDYHMQRLLLRTGCIEVLDEELKSALQQKERISSDEDVRKASIEAVRIMGNSAEKDFFELDEILWSLGRSCCQEKTLCADKSCNKNPCTFFSVVELPRHEICIFDGKCVGSKDKEYRRFWEPIVDTHYY